jgi:PAS domain S-box-containing protein
VTAQEDSASSPPIIDPALERVAGQRESLLALAASLARSLDPRAVAARLLEVACSTLGAPEGWVVALSEDGDAVDLLAASGYPPETLEPWSRVPLEVPVPMTRVIQTGKPLFHRSAAERRNDFPALASTRPGLGSTEGSAVVPLGVEGNPVGALAVAFREPRDFSEDERWFLESLAAHGSQALDRARLFAQVEDRDARLRFTLAASGTGTWEWDIVRDRLDWSPEMLRLHGLGGGTAPGVAEWLDMIDSRDRRAVREAVRETMRTGETVSVEFRVHARDGEVRWVHAAGRVLRGADGHPARVLGTGRDITTHKLAEAERDRMLEAERENVRLREAFIGVVSHELRTPITTIFGGARVLARRWRELDPVARDDILGDIVDDSDRLYRMVEDLLVLTRVERGMLEIGDEPIHLGRIVDRVVASEQPRWPGVAFEVEVPADLPSATGEDTYVEQVLRNLLGNAAKYGGPGTAVRVELDADADDVILRVLDEGPGIDPAEAERLFELFYRSPAVVPLAGGAGIGLFVCRQLVEAMGGAITGERRPGGGAAFSVTLPRCADDDPV